MQLTPAIASRPAQTGPAAAEARALCLALHGLGFAPGLLPGAGSPRAYGVGLCLPVRECVADRASLEARLERVRALLLGRQHVTLTLTDSGRTAARRIEHLLRRLDRAVSGPCIDRRLLGLAVMASELPLPAYLVSSRVWLGGGARYVVFDAGRAGCYDAAWSTIFQQRGWRRPLRPVYGAAVRARCPLLDEEGALTVVGPQALHAPAGSAWLTLKLHLCRFADATGELRMALLQDALARGLAFADQLFDRLRWSTREEQRDAVHNRRIAFCIDGIGDLVRLRGDDPSDFRCLRKLDQLLAMLHDTLWRASAQLARQRGALPALSTRMPARRGACHDPRWQQRWRDALAEHAVRHRNLLVLSPCTLLPQCGADARAYVDLLPLLAHADAVSFAGLGPCRRWNFREFSDFHRRAATILQRRNAAQLVAGGG